MNNMQKSIIRFIFSENSLKAIKFETKEFQGFLNTEKRWPEQFSPGQLYMRQSLAIINLCPN